MGGEIGGELGDYLGPKGVKMDITLEEKTKNYIRDCTEPLEEEKII